jgi:hypothetical protein
MEHAACIGEIRNEYKIFIRNPAGKRPLGRPNVIGRLILEWILEK